MSKTINPLVLIGTLSGRGRDYTRARNAFIAREAIIGTKQADVVKVSGVDKGDVSRIFKVALALGKGTKARKAILALNPASVDVERYATIVDAVTIGSTFERTNKQSANKGSSAAGAKPVPAPESGNVRVAGTNDDGKAVAEDRGILEVAFEWLVSDYDTNLPLFNAMLAQAESYVADQAAA